MPVYNFAGMYNLLILCYYIFNTLLSYDRGTAPHNKVEEFRVSDTKFFVELPYDMYGNTSKQLAVVEAHLVFKNGRKWVVPVAPENFVAEYPEGWQRSESGGWAETTGPACLLGGNEWKSLVDSLSDEVRRQANSNIVELRNGTRIAAFMLSNIMKELSYLSGIQHLAFCDLAQLCVDPNYKPNAKNVSILWDHRLLVETLEGTNIAYIIPDNVRNVVVSMTRGEGTKLKFGNPIVG